MKFDPQKHTSSEATYVTESGWVCSCGASQGGEQIDGNDLDKFTPGSMVASPAREQLMAGILAVGHALASHRPHRVYRVTSVSEITLKG